jgi:hypothetical protein
VSSAAAGPGALPALEGPALGLDAGRHGAAVGEDGLERLTSLLDRDFLQAIGWDAVAQVFVPPATHPQLGYGICLVPDCDVLTYYPNGL